MAILRVSLDEDGQQFDEQRFLNDVSRDGRHVLFGPFGITDVGAPGGQGLVSYDFDTVTGERQPILIDLVSPVTTTGSDFLVGDADASVIAFDEFTDSLVPGDGTEKDVFVLDRASGTVVRASEAEDRTGANGLSTRPLLTADGTQAFFSSEATNLVPDDANGLTDVFVRDLGTGALANLTPTRDGDTAGFDFAPQAVSADGFRLLLVGGTPDGTGEGTFLLDRGADALTRVSERGSPGRIFGELPDLSGDGRVALLPGDQSGLVLEDLESGDVTTLVERGFVGSAGLSEDGRFAAFVTDESGLVPSDADGGFDTFVFDGLSGETWRVNLDDNGEPLAGLDRVSLAVETSPSGDFPIVAFNTDLPLADGDTNDTTDVYAIEIDAIAVADRAVTAPGAPVRIDVLANDVDLDGVAPSIAEIGPVADGTAVVEDGAIVFTPAPGFADSTSFTYTLDDGEGNLDEAIVRVFVAEEGPLTVTTAEDAVATDGELSLREAVETANGRAGADTIGFADGLKGGTLVLEQGTLVVTDELVVDGDEADGGAGGVTLQVADDGGPERGLAAAVRATGTDLRLEDLTLVARSVQGFVAAGVVGVDTGVALIRGALGGFGSYGGDGAGIRLHGGSLLLHSSTISGIGGYDGATGISGYGADVRVVGSTVSNIGSDYSTGIATDGALEVVDTLVRDISGHFADGIVSGGDAVIAGTTITDVHAGLYAATGLTAGGAFTLANSTISGIYSDEGGGGVLVRETGQGTVTNTTIAGNRSSSLDFAGLVVEDGATLRLENSLAAGNLLDEGSGDFETASDVGGGISSNGHNVFGQAAVPGATAGDVTGADARDLFAVLDAEGQPVVADNGGPTPTVALLDAPGNPALDAADPATAPELDQRGFARVGLPDVGSFEAGAGDGDGGGLEGLPPLAEKVAVDPSLVNGVDEGLLRGDGETPFTVTFLGGVAAKDNALGYYVVQEEADEFREPGFILDIGVLFASTEAAQPGAAVRVGALEEGQALGLFLVADGADLNGDRLAGNPGLAFFDRRGNTAAVSDPVPDLFLAEPDDFDPVLGQVLHAADFVDGDEGNALNPGGVVRTLSGRGADGSLLVAWEDQTAGSDEDFNDAIVRVEGPGLGTGIAGVELGDIAAGQSHAVSSGDFLFA
jgi:hypothetical protein